MTQKDRKMQKMLNSPLLRQYAAVIIVNLSVFTAGMSLSWPSPMLVKLSNGTTSPLDRPITAEEGSWIVSAGFLCAVFSNFVLAALLDIIGRKYCIILSYLPKLTMGLLFIFATEVWMIILGRTFVSMFDVYTCIVTPIYTSEIADKEYRGALGTMLQLFSTLGELVTLSVGPYVSYKTFNIIYTSIVAVVMIPALLLPESPSFLYSKGQEEETIKTLKYLRIDDISIQQELEEYKINQQRNKTLNAMTFFKRKEFRKALALGVVCIVGLQLVGFNVITFYLQTIFISTHTNISSEISSVIIGIIQVLMSFVSHALLSSRFRRKVIFVGSLSGICLGMIGIGTFFNITERGEYEVTGFLNYLPLISLILIICCFSGGIGSLVWVIIGEIFDDSTRAFGVSFSISAANIFMFLTAKFFPTMTKYLGPSNTYWFFSVMAALFIMIILFYLPETKGKTFSEIQRKLRGKSNEEIVIKK